MVCLLKLVVAIGLAAVLLAPDVASAAGRHSGDRLSRQGSGYTVEEVAPSTPAALAGITIMATSTAKYSAAEIGWLSMSSVRAAI